MANYGYLFRFIGRGKRHLLENHKQMSVFKMDLKSFSKKVSYLDPSELYRPDYKKGQEYRYFDFFESNPVMNRVFDIYKQKHTKQTVEYVMETRTVWSNFVKTRLSVMDALDKMKDLVDISDPKLEAPVVMHAFQTAEGLRYANPNEDWLHLTGLVHDLGKIMLFFDAPEWAVVGDTFPVGCDYADSIVYKNETFRDNPDLKNPKYKTPFGIYPRHCGFDNLFMSWGHDEYLYRVLFKHPKCKLPDKALYIIRFHSFYPWHQSGDYEHLSNEKDQAMLRWLKEFSKFDQRFTKGLSFEDIEQLKPYYQTLIDKYIPGIINW